MAKQGRELPKSAFFFFIFLLLNGLIYVYRDGFQYKPYISLERLYASGTNVQTGVETSYTPQEFARARQIMASVIQPHQTTAEKLKSIGAFLLRNFGNQRGAPSAAMLRCRILAAFDSLKADSGTRAWCGHFAHMMLLFAAAENIKCRYIEVAAPNGQHVLNEFYLPETEQWVMMDVYNNLIFTLDKNGNRLHTQAFRNKVNSKEAVWALTWQNDTIETTQVDINSGPIKTSYGRPNRYYYYQTTNLQLAYSFREKWKRYLLPQSWYYIYADEKESNLFFYGKLAALAGLLATGALFIAAFINSRHD